VLDLALAFEVVGEEVAGDLDVLVLEVEVRPRNLTKNLAISGSEFVKRIWLRSLAPSAQ
jgi:hypothetical protein